MSEPTVVVVHMESHIFGKAVEGLMASGLSTLAAIAYAAHDAQERQDRIKNRTAGYLQEQGDE
jgi:uncharacterized protein YoaH (UPF0181 family)